MFQQLSENIQRENLTPYEISEAISNLKEKENWWRQRAWQRWRIKDRGLEMLCTAEDISKKEFEHADFLYSK